MMVAQTAGGPAAPAEQVRDRQGEYAKKGAIRQGFQKVRPILIALVPYAGTAVIKNKSVHQAVLALHERRKGAKAQRHKVKEGIQFYLPLTKQTTGHGQPTTRPS